MTPRKLILVRSGTTSTNSPCKLSYIEQADLVCYMVADPSTETYIHTKNPNNFNLENEKKPRDDTYVQMAEVCLNPAGRVIDIVPDTTFSTVQAVSAAFRSHPRVFVSPIHRVIALARFKCFKAVILPGVSTEDYLFADLGIDPATTSLLTYEATNLLIRNRELVPSSPLV